MWIPPKIWYGFGITRCIKIKWWISEMVKRVVAECLQLQGGYGWLYGGAIALGHKSALVVHELYYLQPTSYNVEMENTPFPASASDKVSHSS